MQNSEPACAEASAGRFRSVKAEERIMSTEGRFLNAGGRFLNAGGRILNAESGRVK